MKDIWKISSFIISNRNWIKLQAIFYESFSNKYRWRNINLKRFKNLIFSWYYFLFQIFKKFIAKIMFGVLWNMLKIPQIHTYSILWISIIFNKSDIFINMFELSLKIIVRRIKNLKNDNQQNTRFLWLWNFGWASKETSTFWNPFERQWKSLFLLNVLFSVNDLVIEGAFPALSQYSKLLL